MSPEKNKTGESIDPIKQDLIIPIITRIILQERSPNRDDLVVCDFGTGDFSMFRNILLNVEKEGGVFIRSVALIDIEDRKIPNIIEVTESWKNERRNILLISDEVCKQEPLILALSDPCLDVAHSSNVFHQIENDSEILLSMINISRGLREDGIFVLTDLHPEYLQWLLKNSPEKLKNIKIDEEGNLISADYRFDSGGSKPVFNRELLRIVELGICAGLQPVFRTDLPLTEKFSEIKPRYQKMIEEDIPMFYTIVFKKVPGEIEIIEGQVDTIFNSVKLKNLAVFRRLGFKIESNRVVKKGDRIIFGFGHSKSPKGEPYSINTIVVIPSDEHERIYSLLGVKQL